MTGMPSGPSQQSTGNKHTNIKPISLYVPYYFQETQENAVKMTHLKTFKLKGTQIDYVFTFV